MTAYQVVGETVTLIRADGVSGEDRYGNPVPGDPDETSRPGCLFAPATSTEPTEPGRASVVTPATLYDPQGRDWRSSDQVRVRGDVFQVQGDPQAWPSGTVIELKRVRG